MTKPISLITGSSRGIGFQIAIDLLEAGHFVIFNCRTIDSVNDLKLKLHKNKINSQFYYILKPLDLSKSTDVDCFIEIIKNNFANIDNVIFNVGETCRKEFLKTSLGDWNNVLNTNCLYPIKIIQELLSIISKRIIFIGSVSGHITDAVSIPYGTSKGMLEILTKYLAKEFAKRKITVNTIAPGYTNTDWHIKKSLDQIRRIENKILLKRFAKTKEISSACKFIIENDYVNGQTICVDGGFNFD